MTAATTGTAADYGPDLASVSRLPQRDSLTAMTAPTTERLPITALTWHQFHALSGPDSLRAVSSARRHEHGFRVKDIGVQ